MEFAAELIADRWLELLAQPEWRLRPFPAMLEALRLPPDADAVIWCATSADDGELTRFIFASTAQRLEGQKVEETNDPLSMVSPGRPTWRTVELDALREELPTTVQVDDGAEEDDGPERVEVRFEVFSLWLAVTGADENIAGLPGHCRRFRNIIRRNFRESIVHFGDGPRFSSSEMLAPGGDPASEFAAALDLRDLRELIRHVTPEGTPTILSLYLTKWSDVACYARGRLALSVEGDPGRIARAASYIRWTGSLPHVGDGEWPKAAWAGEIDLHDSIQARELFGHLKGNADRVAEVLRSGAGLNTLLPPGISAREIVDFSQRIPWNVCATRFGGFMAGEYPLSAAFASAFDALGSLLDSDWPPAPAAGAPEESAPVYPASSSEMHFTLEHEGRLLGFLTVAAGFLEAWNATEVHRLLQSQVPRIATHIAAAVRAEEDRDAIPLIGNLASADLEDRHSVALVFQDWLHRNETVLWSQAELYPYPTAVRAAKYVAVAEGQRRHQRSEDDFPGLEWPQREDAWLESVIVQRSAIDPVPPSCPSDALIRVVPHAQPLHRLRLEIPLRQGDTRLRVESIRLDAAGTALSRYVGVIRLIERSIEARLDERRAATNVNAGLLAMSLRGTQLPLEAMAADLALVAPLFDLRAAFVDLRGNPPDDLILSTLKDLRTRLGSNFFEFLLPLVRRIGLHRHVGQNAADRFEGALTKDGGAVPVSEVIYRAFALAGLSFGLAWNKSDSIPRFALQFGNDQRYIEVQDSQDCLGGRQLMDVSSTRREIAAESVFDFSHRLNVKDLPSHPVPKPQLVLAVLEDVFLTAMSAHVDNPHEEPPVYRIDLDVVSEPDSVFPGFVVGFRCDPATAAQGLEGRRSVDIWRTLLGQAPGFGSIAAVERGDGLSISISPASRFNPAIREITSMLTYEAANGLFQAARQTPGTLLAHESDRRVCDRSRWDMVMRELGRSTSWRDHRMRSSTYPVGLGELIRNLYDNERVFDDDLDSTLFDAGYIWDDRRREQGGAGLPSVALATGYGRWEKDGASNIWNWDDHAVRIRFPTDILPDRRFFISIPEWFEILVCPPGASGRFWRDPASGLPVSPTDSLVANSLMFWKQHASGGEVLTFILALDRGLKEGWDEGGPGITSQNGHRFRIWAANNGPGMPDYASFVRSIKRRPGALMKHVIPRAMVWCEHVRLYWFNSESDNAMFRTDLNNPSEEPQVSDDPGFDSTLREHFRKRGVCFEFSFFVKPASALPW